MKTNRIIGLVASLLVAPMLSGCNTSHVHDLKVVQAAEPDCIHEGHQKYYECMVEGCGKIFLDNQANQETTLEEITIAATGIHTGGEATCTSKAICDVCGQEYGELGEHHYTHEVVDNKYLAAAATCTEKAKYYYSCECGEKGTETFDYGEALGHEFETIGDNYLTTQCTRCDTYRHLYEAENMKSNAWNTEDAEYRDKLWKIPGIGSGDWVVKRVYDNAVETPNRVWLEFDADMLNEETFGLYFKLALSSTSVPRNSWKVLVNGQEATTTGDFVSPTDGDWNTDTFREYYWGDVTLNAGHNQVRLIISDDCRCNIDFVSLVGSSLSGEHSVKLVQDEGGETHHYACSDEGCAAVGEAIACVYDQRVATAEHLSEGKNYYYSCVCGRNGTETFEADIHVHEMAQLVTGQNDVKVCSCGKMERKFDLATSYSESWSEGTAKTDALWRQLGTPKTDLDSGHWVSHINDVTHTGENNDKYWIAIGVEFEGGEDIQAELILNAGINDGSWDNIVVRVNEVIVTPANSAMNKQGWDTFVNSSFGMITLKANQTNTIRISPKQGCQMNWGYLQLNSDVNTTNATDKIASLIK